MWEVWTRVDNVEMVAVGELLVVGCGDGVKLISNLSYPLSGEVTNQRGGK